MNSMKRYLYRFIANIERSHLPVYLILFGFWGVFHIILKLASGHQFYVTSSEKLYFLLYVVVFFLAYVYKLRLKLPQVIKNIVLYLFLIASLATFILGLIGIFYIITFDFGYREELMTIIILFYIIPILFLLANFFLIKSIYEEVTRKQNSERSPE